MAKLKISAKRDGFRRAGRAWPREPVEVDSGEFSKDQLEALRAEPMLTIEESAKGRGRKQADK